MYLHFTSFIFPTGSPALTINSHGTLGLRNNVNIIFEVGSFSLFILYLQINMYIYIIVCKISIIIITYFVHNVIFPYVCKFNSTVIGCFLFFSFLAWRFEKEN